MRESQKQEIQTGRHKCDGDLRGSEGGSRVRREPPRNISPATEGQRPRGLRGSEREPAAN